MVIKKCGKCAAFYKIMRWFVGRIPISTTYILSQVPRKVNTYFAGIGIFFRIIPFLPKCARKGIPKCARKGIAVLKKL